MSYSAPLGVTKLGVIVLVLLGMSIAATGAVSAQQVDVNASDLSGNGTVSDPYVITNASELQAMEDDLSAHYELAADIDANETATWNGGTGFAPVGIQNSPFTGSFDGANHTITALTINRASEDTVGLFGVSSGTITDIRLKDVRITGNDDVGSLVGLTLAPSTVNHTSATGEVTGSTTVGGLIGGNENNVKRSSATVTVNGSSIEVGGLIGFNGGTVSTSYATGTVDAPDTVGGLVGRNIGIVTKAYATGDVNGSKFIGGLLGVNTERSGIPGAQVTESYAAGTVTGSNSVGGLIGYNSDSVSEAYWDTDTTGQGSSSAGTGLSTDQMTGEPARTNMTGFDFTATWTVVSAGDSIPPTPTSNGYPILSVLDAQTQLDAQNSSSSAGGGRQIDVDPSDLSGSGTASDPYVITNASELQAMEDDLSAYYELGSDINASSTAQWNNGSGFDPVGGEANPFTGSFDGNNHTLTGLTIAHPDQNDTGLFGVNSGTLRDISLTNVTVTGSEFVGGLVGENDRGTIQNVSVSGSVNGNFSVGGLVGRTLFGTIQKASASASVTGTGQLGRVGGLVGFNDGGRVQNASASGSVNGDIYVGGLVGFNRNTGAISGATIQTASASGNVTGTEGVGGLVGWNQYTIQTASASGSVSGTEDVGGLVGFNKGTIQNASASGSINATGARVGGLVGFNSRGTIQQTVAVGPVSGNSAVGGLVGDNTLRGIPGKVKDSYFDEQATGQPTSAGNATGLTTAQMTGQAARSNMTGLAFGTVWQIQPNDYPELIALTQAGKTPPSGGGGDAIIVDASGSEGNYTSIQPALDNASDGDTIEVRPGTYEESVDIHKNVTLVAPNGATIANTSATQSPFGIVVFRSAAPTIDGFELTNWRVGVGASNTKSGGTITNVAFRSSETGVNLFRSTGAWTIAESTITNSSTGVFGFNSSGDWTVRDTIIDGSDRTAIEASEAAGSLGVSNISIRNVGDGIDIERATGPVTISSTSIRNSTEDAIDAVDTTGDLAIQDTSIYNVTGEGIKLDESSGNWTIQNTTVANTGDDGIDADKSSGNWTIQNTSIEHIAGSGIDAGRLSGAPVIRNTTVRNTGIGGQGDHGIEVEFSTATWLIESTTIQNISGDGIDAFEIENGGTINNVTITDTDTGVNLYNSSGPWTITDSVIENNSVVAITAGNADGEWAVHQSVLTNGTGPAIDANGAKIEGNATHNYWGAPSGPGGDFPGAGGGAYGNLSVEPYYTDRSLTTLTGGGGGSGQSISLSAHLDSVVNNVGAPVKVTANATQSSGSLDRVSLVGPNGTVLNTVTCSSSSCQGTLQWTPSSSSWESSQKDYGNVTLKVRAVDTSGNTTTTTVETAVYIAGDATGDGTVNIFDAVIMGQNWRDNTQSFPWTTRQKDAADINNDGTVNIFDAVIMGQNWRQSASP